MISKKSICVHLCFPCLWRFLRDTIQKSPRLFVQKSQLFPHRGMLQSSYFTMFTFFVTTALTLITIVLILIEDASSTWAAVEVK